MSDQKDSHDDHDPDYATPGPSDEAHQMQFEENARTNVARTITGIVEREFSREIDTKEKEILEIEERLHKAMKTLHFLRYVIITDFYNRKQCQNVQGLSESKQTRIHPAIKQMIGKSPRIVDDLSVPSTSKVAYPPDIVNLTIKEETTLVSEVDKRLGNFNDICNKDDTTKNSGKRCRNENGEIGDEPMKKMPRYVPPKSGIPEPQVPSRGARHKIRKRIVVGNISKWIPPDWREDAASHKWTMYVRGSKENADIADFVGKVRFFLHPSYRPNDVVEVTSPPFHLSRRGWGEFPLRVQLHFKNPLNKPMDIIHYLKLDRTYTGLQTLGSETVVDVWIKTALESSSTLEARSNEDILKNIKKEPEEIIPDTNYEKTYENFPNPSITTKIKEEPREMDNTSSYVHLEHDYANFPHENAPNNENNVTISHSPPRSPVNSLLNIAATNGVSEKLKVSTRKLEQSTDTIVHEEVVASSEKDSNLSLKNVAKITNGKIPESTTIFKDSSGNFLPSFRGIDSSNINASIDVKTMASSLENSSSKMQPLKISIPASFEALKKTTKNVQKTKQILILKDNKLVPIDSMNISISRGVSLLKKPPQIGKVIQNDGKVALKFNPRNSLILNAVSAIPALKLVDTSNISDNKMSRPINTTNDYCADKQDLKNSLNSCKIIVKPKITLGKDKIGATSKKENYEAILRSIDDAKITDVAGLVRFVLRRIPLISERATDPEYRTMHPYVCASEKEFLDSNVGKQRALEWYRARHVRSFFKKKNIPEPLQWSVKEIMIWSRLHGFTPTRSMPIVDLHPRNKADKSSEKNVPGDTSDANLCTLTEPLDLLEYLRNARDTKAIARGSNVCENEIEIVDVENLTDETSEKSSTEIFDKNKRTTISLGIPDKLVGLQTYVTNTARQIGVKLGPEEIIPGVTHCASARLIVKSVQCLLEDLLRSSVAKACERRNDGGCPDTITLDDVRGAILNREEFDVFTNEGLASHHCPDD